MANAISEPPRTDSNSSRYLVGQDSRGRWVVQGTRGLSGGLFFDGQAIEASLIVAGLESIAGHRRCRLPVAEIEMRLTRYRGR
jgi:hypothetical protein